MRLLSRKILSITRASVTSFRPSIFRFLSDDVIKQETVEKDEKDDVEKNVLIEKYEGITTVSIDRTDTRNSLDVDTLNEITEAFNEFEKDTSAKVLVINGEGGSFSSGFDFDAMQESGYNALFDAARRFHRRPLCYKPTIAALSGYAVAEGFELALACDLRIIEETAVIGFLGRRFGVPFSMLGARRLTAMIGLSRALDLIMTGKLISGKEAFNRGLATKCTSTGTALGEAVKLAKTIAKFPQNALIMDKLAAVHSQLNPNDEEYMRDEAMRNSLLGNALIDMKVGIQKFQKGIGKHGKFYQLTEVPLKDWEIEDSETEIILTSEKPSEQKEEEKK